MAGDEPVLQFYDVDNKQVPEGSLRAVRQFLSNDPVRPDATDEERQAIQLPAPDAGPAVVLYYYDEGGKRVPEGSPRAVRQFASDDANRPDAKAQSEPPATKAQSEPTSTKAVTSAPKKK